MSAAASRVEGQASSAMHQEAIQQHQFSDDLAHLEQAIIRQRHVEPPLPEHARRWPQTAEVEQAVWAGYDGTASSCRAVGQTLTSRVEVASGEPYPSWRIEQIAVALGLAEVKRDALIDRLRAEEQERKGARMRPSELRFREQPVAQPVAQPEPQPGRAESERKAMTSSIHGNALHSRHTPAEAAVLATRAAPAAPDASPHAAHSRVARADREARERAAQCAQCGKAFTAKRYSSGWTVFCSAACGRRHTVEQQRREQALTAPSSAAPAAIEAIEAAAQAERDEARDAAAGASDALIETPQAEPQAEPAAPTAAQASEPEATITLDNPWGVLFRTFAERMAAMATTRPLLTTEAASEAADADVDDADDALDELLSLYLNRLPRAQQGERQWTTRERARWLRAFTAALDLVIETTDELAEPEQEA